MARRQPPSQQTKPGPEDENRSDDGPESVAVSPSKNGGYNARPLLVALKSLRKGDFGVRLPVEDVGIGDSVAEAFNEVAELLEQNTRETERIATLVGKEGRITQRARLGAVTGRWADTHPQTTPRPPGWASGSHGLR